MNENYCAALGCAIGGVLVLIIVICLEIIERRR